MQEVTVLWLLVAGVSIALASEVVKRLRQRRASDLSDEEFVNLYRQRFDGEASAIVKERKFIAKCLGLNHLKLRPDDRFHELSKLSGFDTEYQLGMSNLEDQLFELFQQAGIQPPTQFPSTIGELISKLASVKKTLREPN